MPGFSSLTLLAVPSRLVALQEVAGSAAYEPSAQAQAKNQAGTTSDSVEAVFDTRVKYSPHSHRHGQDAEEAAPPVEHHPETPRDAGPLFLFHLLHDFDGPPFRVLIGIAIRARSVAIRMAVPSLAEAYTSTCRTDSAADFTYCAHSVRIEKNREYTR